MFSSQHWGPLLQLTVMAWVVSSWSSRENSPSRACHLIWSNLTLKNSAQIQTWIHSLWQQRFLLMLPNAYTAAAAMWPKGMHLNNTLQCPDLTSFQSACRKYSIFDSFKNKVMGCVCVQIWLFPVVTERNSAWKSPSVHTVPGRAMAACLGSVDLCIPRPFGEENSLAA